MPLRLFDRQAERRHQGLAALRIREHHERRVRALEGPRRLERPCQHVVEVDRAGQLPEDPAAAALLLGALQRTRQLAPELVHALVQAGHDLGHPLVRPGVRAPPDDQQRQEEHYESAQTHADAGQKSCHCLAAGRNETADSL
jgi:hypothetical protein